MTELYQFYFDTDQNADNMFRTWKQEAHPALEISQSLVVKIQEAYAKSMSPDE
jgi:hypothetical protein